MPWIYALELLAVIGCLWRIGSKVSDVAGEIRKSGGGDTGGEE